MNLTHLFKHILDSLWALGGIGAAADLCLEYLESTRGEPCPIAVRSKDAPR